MTFRKFYRHHHELFDLYDVSVSEITTRHFCQWFNIHIVYLLSTERDLFPNMNLHYYTTCLGIYTSSFLIFSDDVSFVGLVIFWVMPYRLWFEFCI